MNSKFKGMIVIFAIAFVSILLLSVSCGNEPGTTTSTTTTDPGIADSVTVQLAYDALTVIYASGDNASSVKQNVTLATAGTNGSEITWISDNGEVISTNGTVTRPMYYSNDASVNLTATISKGSVSTNKEFALTVIAYTNRFPVVSAGTNLAFSRSSIVQLTGTASDPDNDSLTYLWEQTSGTNVTLSNETGLTVSFVAPDVTSVLEFSFTVTDGELTNSDSLTVNIGNVAPTVDAGTNQSVSKNAIVQLTATANDPDGDTMTYQWTQTSGSNISLSGATTLTPSFTSPEWGGDLVFEFTASDGELSNSDTVTVTVVNHAPIANAGTNQTVMKRSAVQLTATASDSDGDSMTYLWVQTLGTIVTLTNADTLTPSFGSPSTSGNLGFNFIADDGQYATTDSVTIAVFNNAPTADAGTNQTVTVEDSVQLTASTNDTDGDVLTFEWVQTSGATVTLTGEDTLTPTFTAPSVRDTLVFDLNVFDGEVTNTDTVTVTVNMDTFDLIGSDTWIGDNFGNSVSTSSNGEVIIIGAPSHQGTYYGEGSAYIYEWNGASWDETKLVGPDPNGSTNYFGMSVAVSGDGNTAVVGAPNHANSQLYQGAIYVYERNGGNWDVVTKITNSDNFFGDFFGQSVSISYDGTTVLASALRRYSESGTAYVYDWNGSGWDETMLRTSDGATNTLFGCSVALSDDGDTAIVGAYTNTSLSMTGSAYIFERNGGSWDETKLTASDGNKGDRFGFSVSLSADGTSAIVGSYYNDANGINSGAAYLYEWNGGGWDETKLTASNGITGDFYGKSVSISDDGNSILIGATGFDYSGISGNGTAYVYKWSGVTWQESQIIQQASFIIDSNVYFGLSVSLSGSGKRCVIGAPYDDNPLSDSGSAYSYYGF